jgi:hypothetical protein
MSTKTAAYALIKKRPELELAKQRDFPAHVFGDTIKDLLAMHEKLNTAHPSFLAAGMLATLCTAIAGKFYLRSEVTDQLGVKKVIDGKLERGLTIGSQFIAVIAESSDTKSTGLSAFIEPLKDLDRQLKDLYDTRLRLYNELRTIKDEAERAKEAAQLAQTFSETYPLIKDGYDFTSRPELCRYFIDDFTLAGIRPILGANRKANIALCAYKDEMKSFFDQTKRGAAELGTKEQLICFWNGQDWLIVRKGEIVNGQYVGGAEDVRNPAFCFVGGLQPAVLKHFINDENIDQGFVGRFLIFAPQDVQTLPKRIKTADERATLEDLTRDWTDLIRHLHDAEPRVFSLDAEAARRHQLYEATQAVKMNALRATKDVRRTLLSKAIELMPRLALAIHAAREYTTGREASNTRNGAVYAKAKTIGRDVIELAITLTNYFEAEINALVGQGERGQLKAIPDDALVLLHTIATRLEANNLQSIQRSDLVKDKAPASDLKGSGVSIQRLDRLFRQPLIFAAIPNAKGCYSLNLTAAELEAEISSRPTSIQTADEAKAREDEAKAREDEARARNAEMNETLEKRPLSLVPDGNGGYKKVRSKISLKL